ncbi:bZIP transcription factor 60 [Ziziphus jujuba]|uniref:BZIP transcription factor 60 n=1 Tax=Ziziphus jujuba TaxID=326968 RepID=A0A6P3ZMJ1_ZIZJJ|nr:bZIP transcription factor 60 [Ziziphus jujuba]
MEEELEFLEADDVIDWSSLLDELPEGANTLDWETEAPILNDSSSSSSSSSSSLPLAAAATDSPSNHSPDPISSWIGQIETLLMKEDDADDANKVASEPPANDFLADILVDSPAPAQPSDDHDLGLSTDKEELEVAPVQNDSEDLLSKKRTRQLRNRDAAVRSRERKKVYVKDLEMKSKYLEGECRRLGRLLQCCYAENQALRFSLQMGNSFGSPTTKQESAVLLLESLLLGSLLWLVVIMGLFILTVMPLRNLEPLQLEDEGKKALEREAPKGGETKIFGYFVVGSFVKSRRCKASWTKMKQCFLVL